MGVCQAVLVPRRRAHARCKPGGAGIEVDGHAEGFGDLVVAHAELHGSADGRRCSRRSAW